jgi:hypothetical protein
MNNGQAKQEIGEEKRESGEPGGGQGRVDEVGKSGVYPVSEIENAPDDAVVQGEKSFGQGERGAEGYKDAGSSEIFYLNDEKKKEGDGR